jgi:hypothetical protein
MQTSASAKIALDLVPFLRMVNGLNTDKPFIEAAED